jgi:hypothetical protein
MERRKGGRRKGSSINTIDLEHEESRIPARTKETEEESPDSGKALRHPIGGPPRSESGEP